MSITMSALMGTMVVLLCGTVADAQGTRPASDRITFQDFMTLPAEERLPRFSGLSPENKAVIMRTHAERWLDANRNRLSRQQVELVQKAIAFVTPSLYRTPNAPEVVKTSKELEADLRCRLRHSDALEAFDPIRSPATRASWLEDMWNWLEGCVLG